MLVLFLALLGGTTPDSAEFPATFVQRDWLVIDAVDRRGRRPFRPDAVFAKHLLVRDAAPPREGDALVGEFGKEQHWRKVEADANGAIPGKFGYAYAAIDSPEDVVVMAKLAGALALYVNGAGFTGDVYAYGFGGVPIALRKGANHVFVSGARGTASLVLERPASELVFGTWDFTVPHARPEHPVPVSALVFNATQRELRCALIRTNAGGDAPSPWEGTGQLAPLALARMDGNLPVPAAGGARDFEVECVVTFDDVAPARTNVRIPFADAAGPRLVPYVSAIDGSLQTVAVRGEGRPVLTLHGASVDAWGQIASYSDHAGFQIIAPRNRRPYGFDWQDWGRTDAYEALVAVRGRADERCFVTGHSMGGHGTWHFAANDPDRVLALAPSAGWCSFDTYDPRPQGELRELWHAADGASRTEELVANLATTPAFVMHGEADDNVPASEGRAMLERLVNVGAQPLSHFEPGAGHWWDGDKAAGADCVDWPAIFELFDATKAPEQSPDELHWLSVDPGIDAEHFWLRVEQPLVYGRPFQLDARRTPDAIEIATRNVRWLAVELHGRRRAALDGEPFELPAAATAAFARDDGRWRLADGPYERSKSSRACGPFKRAFARDFRIVYGTAGTPAESAELLERARADQQQWWYRANGAPRLVSDALVARPERDLRSITHGYDMRNLFEPDGEHSQPHWSANLILYGNADTNAAWASALPRTFPIRVHRGRIEIEDRKYEGDNLACVFVAPRADEDSRQALVGVFGDTGIAGTRVGYTLQPFTSGVGYPDYVIYSTDVLTKGDGGVLEAGWFDRDWKVQRDGSFRRASAR
jgi:pimeloyl-ACP methyl ester carboxylesterase